MLQCARAPSTTRLVLYGMLGAIEEQTKQAVTELGQAQVKLDDIVEVVVDVVVIAVVQVEV